VKRRRALLFLVTWLVPGLALGLFHLTRTGFRDTPDSAAITFVQAATAAFANSLGPWSSPIVHAVDFPNAGTRMFDMSIALAMSLAFALLCWWGVKEDRMRMRWLADWLFVIFIVVWYGYGFRLITDGLL
jgi:hypothetical protein